MDKIEGNFDLRHVFVTMNPSLSFGSCKRIVKWTVKKKDAAKKIEPENIYQII